MCTACHRCLSEQLPRYLLCILIHVSLLIPDFDPGLGLMTGIAPINPLMPGLGLVPPPVSQDVPVVKEIIHCKSCTLFPPNPSKCHSSYRRCITEMLRADPSSACMFYLSMQPSALSMTYLCPLSHVWAADTFQILRDNEENSSLMSPLIPLSTATQWSIADLHSRLIRKERREGGEELKKVCVCMRAFTFFVNV